MRQARAVHLPNEALYMEEIKFWLQDMQDHTLFIRRGLPPDKKDFSDASQEFHRAFSVVLQKIEKLKSVKQLKSTIGETKEIVQEFQKFQRKILADILCGRIQGSIFPFFIDHMLRESQYFLELLQSLDGEKDFKTVSHTRELVIWLRFLADHMKLTDHYIDPSERRMRKMASDFAELFERLGGEARDWASMLYCHKGTVHAFERFVMDVRVDVQRLRDFYKMAEDLIADCRLLGIMTVDLAGHMRREADHCLLILTCLEKDIFKHDAESFQDDIDSALWQDTERIESDDEKEDEPDYEIDEEKAVTDSGEDEVEVADDNSYRPMQEDQNDAPIWIMPAEDLRSQVVIPQAPIQPEDLYVKAGENHHRPGNLVGTAPSDHYSKGKRPSPLPRPLGKGR